MVLSTTSGIFDLMIGRWHIVAWRGREHGFTKKWEKTREEAARSTSWSAFKFGHTIIMSLSDKPRDNTKTV